MSPFTVDLRDISHFCCLFLSVNYTSLWVLCGITILFRSFEKHIPLLQNSRYTFM